MSNQGIRVQGRAAMVALAIGIVLAAIPFLGSLKPSQLAKELNQFKKIDISEFENNSWEVVRVRRSKKWNEGSTTVLQPGRAWLIVRDKDGHFRVFGIPTYEGSFLMGLMQWGQFEGYCENIGPNPDQRVFDQDTEILCNDENNDEYFRDHWRWTLDGKNVTGVIIDLEILKSEVRRNELVVYGQRWSLD